MSRKMKPNKLFDETIQQDETTADVNVEKNVEADDNPIIGNGRMSQDDVEKLAKYDAMEKSLAAMSAEKEMLEAKVAEYISKLDAFKDASDKINELEKKNQELASKCKQLEEKVTKSAKFDKEIAALRDENDQYLIKISELTFENANLTCQMSELEKKIKAGGNVANQKQFALQQGVQNQMGNGLARPNRDAYNPYANNGYGTW